MALTRRRLVYGAFKIAGYVRLFLLKRPKEKNPVSAMIGSSACRPLLHLDTARSTQCTPDKIHKSKKQDDGHSQPLMIAVEGNIGSGKSTFLDYFKTHPRVEVLPEPVDKWKNIHGFNSLDMMYRDAARWSLVFQSYVTLTMLEHHESPKKSRVKMIERSIYSAKHCFIENLHQGGLMPDVDYSILSEWHDWINQNYENKIDLIVYLRASPQNCHDRIHHRNRSEEKDVPIEYLNSLHKLHEEWLIEGKRGILPAPVMVIDANIDLDDLHKKIAGLESEILSGN